MSAHSITSKLIELTNEKKYSLIVANYANPDMIGHTGNLKATKIAIEIIDKCLNNLLSNLSEKKTTVLITADHGNADIMLDKYNDPCKSHSKNLVPFILVNEKGKLDKNRDRYNIKLRDEGSLADIAPTILDLLKLEIPIEMKGVSLV